MKKKNTGIISRILILLAVVLAIFSGGYFFLDKLIVPKYFSSYGIKNIPDLVGVVTSLYKSPKEAKLVTNGFTQTDFSNAVKSLQNSNYLIANDGTIEEKNFEIFKGDKEVTLTDKEFASIFNKLIDEDGILVEALPDFNYLNIINISILEVIITPNNDLKTGDKYNGANISFIAKLDTVDIREQIATQMDTPLFLLNMIIPDILYFEVSYDLDLTKAENERVENGEIAINGRTIEQSEILMNLLIDFIFPEEENMNLTKFTETFGNIILQGIDVLGDFKFVDGLGISGKQNGIYVNPLI